MKLYVFEPNSRLAAEVIVRTRAHAVISWLPEVEMASALHA
jgi:hypothetical protein